MAKIVFVEKFLDNEFYYMDDCLYKLDKCSKKWKCLNNLYSKIGYIKVGLTVNGKLIRYALHRLVYKYHNMDWDINNISRDNSIDHKDRNPKNNKIENLQPVNNSQNQQNTDFATKCKGIAFRKDNIYNPWIARWIETGKRKYKCFKTENEALEYRKKMVELHYYKGQKLI